eukprot:Skav230763  [mRNA]  locus=scaffold4515:162597:167483:+ [translate_table: standard]
MHRVEQAIRDVLLLNIMYRVGEAKNPGPGKGDFILGCANPTGILNKLHLIDELPTARQSIWGISETHLSGQGIRKAQQGLRFRKSVYNFASGAPCPLRSLSETSIGGKQSGVGFLSTVPNRALTPTWSSEAWDEARFAVRTFLTGDAWIHGAVIYGYAHRAATNEVRTRTDQLLDNALHRVLRCMSGKRFLLGDWNQEIGQLRTFEILRQHGWVEVQEWALAQYGRPIEKTCQSTSTKDFIWVSPELIPHLRKVHTANLFKDHLLLWVEIEGVAREEPVHLWRKPKPIAWDQVQAPLPEDDWSLPSGTTQEQVEFIAAEFEQRLHQQLRSQTSQLYAIQRGRSKTQATHVVNPQQAPIKPSRQGHVNPAFHGQSLKHAQWFKQLRRLESIARAHSQSERALQHKQREWTSILRAPGFGTSFAVWWKTVPHRLDQAPSKLPDLVPSFPILLAVQHTFEREFRAFEQVFLTDCHAIARKTRHDNPQRIFQDVKVPSAQPVSLLDYSVKAEITDVDATECALYAPTDKLDPSKPLFTSRAVAEVIHMDVDKIWVQNFADFRPGDVLHQDKHVGSLTKIFALFAQEWEKRWDRHLHVPTDEWDPMVQFFTEQFPAGEPMPQELITPEQWYQCLRRKKKRAAVGPDGWARQDLLSMPRDLVVQLLRILHDVERGADWPITAITGLICSLAKVPEASLVTQYRPITVFSLIYRTWSSLRAKSVLRHLEKYAPAKCFGNLPLRTASQVWLGIQSELESANTFDGKVSGVTIDIQKCFNHLPRIPIFAICHHLGVATPILRSWSNALHRMTRRFVVRGSVSPGLTSTTGCAEGCALSVVGMLALNIMIDCWLSHKVPAASLWTYVDNMELTSPNVTQTLEGLTQLRRAATGLDLLIDEDKTIVWANTAPERKVLRDHQHRVVAAARDLGGHVQYTQQTTNSTITNRIQKFKPRWRDFARSPAPRKQKLIAIKMAAWPNVLHGIASVHLCEDLLDELRAAAMRSIGLSGMGASSVAQFSLIEHPSADPGYYALTKTVMDCRVYLSQAVCIPILEVVSLPNHKVRPSVGPCSVLLHRLNAIGWHWSANTFWDQDGLPIDLWECPIQELKMRLQEAWQLKCQYSLADRKTFGGITQMSPTLTVRVSPSDPGDRGILHTALNGTFFTADHAKHLEEGAVDMCPLCGQPDSQTHRHWECPRLEPARKSNPATRQDIMNCPAATYNHGWIPIPASRDEFVFALSKIPDHSRWHNIPSSLPACLDLFTDGSCLSPDDGLCRLASWGVVVFTPDERQEFSIVSHGLLPGLLQTINRAEAFAAISAVALAIRLQQAFRLWVDSDVVYKAVQRMLRSQTQVVINNRAPNHDVLNELSALLFQVRHLCLGVVKVCSHQAEDPTASWVDNWSSRGNEAADRAAQSAFVHYPQLMQLWGKYKGEITRLQHMRDALHADLIAVGRLAQKLIHDQTQAEKASEATADLTYQVSSFQPWQFPVEGPDTAALYCDDVPQLVEWMQSLHSDEHPVVFWNWQQLLVDWRLHFPYCGPWYQPHPISRWNPGHTCGVQDFHKRNRWFKTWLTKLAAAAGAPLPLRLARPDSFVFQYWTPCLPVRASKERCEALERWLTQWAPAFRQHKDTRQIGGLP